jgi:hypothetical protein
MTAMSAVGVADPELAIAHGELGVDGREVHVPGGRDVAVRTAHDALAAAEDEAALNVSARSQEGEFGAGSTSAPQCGHGGRAPQGGNSTVT